MAYSFVQNPAIVTGGAAASISKAFVSNVTAHSVLVAFVTTDAATPGTFTFTGGGTWATVSSIKETGSTQWIAIGYCLNATGGATTVQAAWTGNGNFNGLIIAEFSAPGGVASTLDASTAGRLNTTSTTPTDASVAASAGDLVVSCVMAANTTTITAGTGFTATTIDATDNLGGEYQLNAAGSVAASFHFSSTQASATMSAAFKPSGGVAARRPRATRRPARPRPQPARARYG